MLQARVPLSFDPKVVCDDDVNTYMNPPRIEDVLISDVAGGFDFHKYWQSFAAYLSMCKNVRDRFICRNDRFVDGNDVLPDQV